MNIMEGYENLTKSERRVLAYVMEHKQQLPLMNIDEVAASTFVSKTVVINLAHKLGFSGYREMKFHLKVEVAKQQAVQQETKSVKDQLRGVIDKSFALLDEQTLMDAALQIVQANNVFIMARGLSKPVAYYLEHVLLALGIHCFFIDDYNLSDSFTNLVTKNDTVLYISLSGNTPKIVSSAQMVQMKGAHIISLTSFNSNKLAALADKNLFGYTPVDNTKSDDSIPRIGLFVVIDLLVGTIKQIL
ncbi:MurR/RpiR family transcriptional regulator [Lacticaseibacillus daqingensis]|uniref:MurR/RpiR family transcriptional regulator n=1 Tax=Lacticaseibacillus daqingensis TaxID=2486014 RepID=UPI000F7AD645|nr:MurR/RpiR family transcriptional regulator [Lacticaseibacillus daqingensis]